ncbi:MAG: hypothetical protein M3153_01855 [Chloroflexota bacterium]|nr:hypothetical protein [Chloroflexota bacterium]
MRVMLVALGLVVFLGGAAMIASIDRRELLTRLLVAIIATLALGALDSRYRWLQGRRYLLRWDPGEGAYFRSILTSFVLVICAGAALVGLALVWP